MTPAFVPPEDLAMMLQTAGWSQGRQVEIEGVRGRLGSVGFLPSVVGDEFLSAFYPLRFDHEPSILLDGARSFCWTSFDPDVVATSRDARTAERCSAIVGESLFPVGTDGFHMTIYITAGLRFYAGRDARVFSYASSVTGLLRAMRDGARPEVVGEWRP